MAEQPLRSVGRFSCPGCGASVSLAKLLDDSQFSFSCKRCDARLTKRLRTSWLGLGGVLVLLWIFVQYQWSWQLGVAALGLLAAFALASYLLGSVTLAPPGMLDGDLATKAGLRDSKTSTPYVHRDHDSQGGDGGGGD